MNGGYRREIDGLRGLAVLAVVLFHAGIPGFAGGFVGVDVFLVISGYLIAGVILREANAGTFTLVGFYERRIRRILPALLAMLAVSAGAAWMLLPADFKQFGASLTAISVFLSNFFFARGSGYFSLTRDATPLLHSWSLAVEEQFYLVFPVLLLLARRTGARGTGIALAAAALLSFLYSVLAVRTDPALAFYSPASRGWEFLVGSLLAWGENRTPPRRAFGDAAALLGMAALGYSVWSLRAESPFPSVNALPPVLGAALFLFGSAAHGSRMARALSGRPLVAIGITSYSLYLWHWPMIVFGGYYVLDDSALRTVRVAMAILAFPVAWLSWRFVERPFRAPQLLLSRRMLFASAAGASLTLAGCGAAIYAAGGLPWRFDPLVQHMSQRGNAPDYGCAGERLGFSPPPPDCRIGDPATPPSFVLWGDSHAAVYVPEFRLLARAYGVSGYQITTLGCPPLFVPQTFQVQGGSGKNAIARGLKLAECRKRNQEAIQFIRQSRPRAVLLAARWGTYAGGKHGDGNPSDLALFDYSIRALRDQGITVYLIFDVPQTAGLSTDKLAKALVVGTPMHFELSTAEYLRSTRAMRAQALDLQRRGLVQVIEPARLLCGRTRCRIVAGEYPLYFDNNHLNARGAHLVGPLFEPAFRCLKSTRPKCGP